MTLGVKCPKCGLMQLPGPTCKSCGAPLGGPARHSNPLQTQAPKARVAPPAPPQSGATIPMGFSQGEAGHDQTLRLTFHGTGGSLFGIHIVNMFLTLVTFGVYYFWAKVRIRKYLLSQTDFEGDRFAYHGTGQELLIGALRAAIVFGVPVAVLNFVPTLVGGGAVVEAIVSLLIFLTFLVFVPFAMVGARRYRLSRTSWRGIRFSFRGPVKDFIKLFVGGSLLTALTLSLYYPIFDTRRQAFMVSHSYFGSQKFAFDGRGRDLFGSYLLAIFLFLPSLGLCWFWFLAKKQRYFWEHTSFGDARFHSTVTGGRLLLLNLGNVLLLIVTLGLAWPWVMIRNARFTFRYLTVEGPLDLAAIQQDAQAATATGEALADFLDAGLDLAG